jgi:hypothetical protein
MRQRSGRCSAGRGDVIGVAALAADQRVVFLAADAWPTPNLMGAAILFRLRWGFRPAYCSACPAAQTDLTAGFAALQRGLSPILLQKRTGAGAEFGSQTVADINTL